jgi:septum formation topological specificity factor MinE
MQHLPKSREKQHFIERREEVLQIIAWRMRIGKDGVEIKRCGRGDGRAGGVPKGSLGRLSQLAQFLEFPLNSFTKPDILDIVERYRDIESLQ